jgi:hypothetical protein
MLNRLVILSCACAAALAAQTTINGSRTILGNWDASGALSTKPNQTGSALPGTCTSGQTFFLTTAPAGQNLYLCQSNNTWNAIASNGGSATTYALIFNGSSTALADGSSVVWTCGSGSAATCTASWTVPSGVNAAHITAFSAGAGGLGSSAGGGGGNGGGGGGYFDGWCPVTPGNAYTVTVGLGGTGTSSPYSANNGGSSAFGTCFALVGGSGAGASNYGGYLQNVYLSGSTGPLYGWNIPGGGYYVYISSYCSPTGSPGPFAIRPDGGGCGAGSNWSSGAAGLAGGGAVYGAGGGGSGGYNNATGGTGGVSGFGGAGGNGGGWTSAGGVVACTNGSIPGGGGGAAGTETTGSNLTGCNGARGEVRVYYTR